MGEYGKDENLDQEVIKSFGYAWVTFDYSESEINEAFNAQFLTYSLPIDLGQFNTITLVAADFSANSGR